MKSLSRLVHVIALAICFMAHQAAAQEFSGIRRAMQTMSATSGDAATAPTLTSIVQAA